MRAVFMQELASVRGDLIETAQGVLEAITLATTAFSDSDVALADRVIGDDAKIDETTARIDDLSIEILVRQAPLAQDLRFIVATMRMSSSFERMGDLAAHIAQLARMRFPELVGPVDLRETFRRAGELDVQVAERVVALLESDDDDEIDRIIEEILEGDDEIDALHKSVLERLTSERQDPNALYAQVVDATLANRYFERFADHAVSIAKRIRYLKDGTPAAPGEASA